MTVLVRTRQKLRRLLVRGRLQAGMATAEYAVGTVGVISLGGVLLKVITDPAFRELLWKVIQWLFSLIMGLFGG